MQHWSEKVCRNASIIMISAADLKSVTWYCYCNSAKHEHDKALVPDITTLSYLCDTTITQSMLMQYTTVPAITGYTGV